MISAIKLSKMSLSALHEGEFSSVAMLLLQLSALHEGLNSFGLMPLHPLVSEIMGRRPFITLITSRKNGLLGSILLAFTP